MLLSIIYICLQKHKLFYFKILIDYEHWLINEASTMGHLNVSLTYLIGLEVAELKEDDMPLL